MQRDQVVSLLLDQCGQRGSDTTLAGQIITAMTFVQESVLEAAAFLPWFLYTETQDLVTVAGTATVTLPSDFLRLFDKEQHYAAVELDDGSGTWRRLRRTSTHDLTATYGTVSGTPEKYALPSNVLTFGPVPDAVYTLRVHYYARGASLAGTYGGDGSTAENVWLQYAADLLRAETGIFVASMNLRDDALAKIFTRARDAAALSLAQRDAWHWEAGRERIMDPE